MLTGRFPVDDVTLAMLRSACEPGPNEERSHLFEFLGFGVDTNTPVDHCEDGTPIYQGGWHPHDVIVALIDEVETLRSHGNT